MAELEDTFSSRWWGQGPKVEVFEREFARKFGHEHVIMTNSCTAALHLAYRLAGIEEGDQVIVPVLTCTATNHPLLLMGAKIVFGDVLAGTLTLDPDDVERKITRKTKAVVTVHLGGCVVNMERLRDICHRKGVVLIEDAAQALGARLGVADFTCYSFQAIKHLSVGDGGMLCVKDGVLEEKARRLRWFDIDREKKGSVGWQAWDRRGITFDQEVPGYKYQPTDIDASIGLVALKSFDENFELRKELVEEYRVGLVGIEDVEFLNRGDQDANWLFTILVDNRDDFAENLMRNGVETNIAHVRNDLFTVFGGKRRRLEGMAEVEARYLCLPLNTKITIENVKYICETVRKYKFGLGK